MPAIRMLASAITRSGFGGSAIALLIDLFSDLLHLLFKLLFSQPLPFSFPPGLSAQPLKAGQFDLPE